ncbi:MAG: hypothetical protein AABW45_02375 [Nanoarchaeota archaeon]
MDWKQKLLALAIAIILVSFIAVGIDTFYKGPKDDCYNEARPKILNCEFMLEPNRTSCYLEQQNEYEIQNQESQKCYEEFQKVDNVYRRNAFIILTIIGVLVIVIGLLVKNINSLSFGLMIGGLVTILMGIVKYWSQMNEYLRFIILGVLLAILIWVSYRKLK